MKALALAVMLLILGIPLQAVDRYVDARFLQTSSTYSPAARGGGGSALSYASIQAAINAMQPGDTLYLRGGQYSETNINIGAKQGSPTAWFTVKSYPGEWARVHGNWSGTETHVFKGMNPAYWRFEYFEVMGGGPRPVELTTPSNETIRNMRGSGFLFRVARHMTFHSLYVHNNYGGCGDNHAGIEVENGGNLVGGAQDILVTHCYLKSNTLPPESPLYSEIANLNVNNMAGVSLFSDYNYNPATVRLEEARVRNEVSFNLVEDTGAGIKGKGPGQFLVPNHDGGPANPANMAHRDMTDQIHHNVVRNVKGMGLSPRSDFIQVHHNIVDDAESGIWMNGDIAREPFHVVLYNNLVRTNAGANGGIVFLHCTESCNASGTYAPPIHPYARIWNNIVESPRYANGLTHMNVVNTGYDGSNLGHVVDMATVWADHNYLRPNTRSAPAVRLSSRSYSSDDYEANGWASRLWADTGDPYQPDSRYKTQGGYSLEVGVTMANGGKGGRHPYLDVALPSYVGAVDLANGAWLDRVLALEQLASRDPGQTYANVAPTVDAGEDRWVLPGESCRLKGFAGDEGLPLGGELSVAWSRLSGPGSVTFNPNPDDPRNPADRIAQFSAEGVYVLRLEASDGAMTAADDITVRVAPEGSLPPSEPPARPRRLRVRP